MAAASASSDELDPIPSAIGFREAIRQYIASIHTLRDMHDLLLPHAAALDARTSSMIESVVSEVPPEKHELLSAALSGVAHMLSEVDHPPEDAESLSPDELARLEELGITITPNEEGTGSRISIEDDEIGAALHDILLDYAHEIARPHGSQLLMRSIVTMGVAALEVLIAQVMSQYFELHPGAMGADEAEFSLNDIQQFASIDDARQALVVRRVDRIHAGGLDTWTKWFRERLDISLERLSIDWDETYEVIQRRHVIVHNGGRVSSQYLKSVRVADPPPLGSVLTLDEEYISQALDHLLVEGVGIAFAAWVDLAAEETPAAMYALRLATDSSARAGRWRATRALCSIASKPKTTEAQQVEFKILGWLARSNLDGADSIRDEVGAWDVSALRRRYAVIKSLLLGEVDTAATLVQPLLESGEVAQRDIVIKPIYEPLRSHPEVVERLSIASLLEVASADDAETDEIPAEGGQLEPAEE